MSPRRVELIVIGGGPAGCAAARTAAGLGVETILIDEQPVDRDAMVRQIPYWYGAGAGTLPAVTSTAIYRWLAGREELQDLVRLGVEVLTRHAVWFLSPDRTVGVTDGRSTWLLDAEQVILATGATDLALSIPGGDAAGVLGAWGALNLFEVYGTTGGSRLVVAGSGNLGLTVARRAQEAGIDVAAVVEIGPRVRGDGRLRAALAARGVPFITRHGVARVRGGSKVEAVEIAGADRSGAPIPGSERAIAADTLCFAVGGAPALELAYLARCDIDFDARRGGYYPVHDRLHRTSVPGVLVAGDAASFRDTGFHRPEEAAAQGRAAAETAAWALGKAERPVPAGSSRSGRPSTRAVPETYATPWHRFADLISGDDVVLCRCEEVTRAVVLRSQRLVHLDHPDEVKRVSRAGMGLCQGRGCRATVAGVLAARRGVDLTTIPVPSYRPPVRPLPLAAMATEEDRPAPLLAPFARLLATLDADTLGHRLPAIRYARWRAQIEQANLNCVDDGRPVEEAERLAADLYDRFFAEVEQEPWLQPAPSDRSSAGARPAGYAARQDGGTPW